MPSMDRHKLLSGCFHCLDVLPDESGGSGEILIALKNKHREGKLQAKLCHSEGSGLRHKHVCKDLALEIVVDVL